MLYCIVIIKKDLSEVCIHYISLVLIKVCCIFCADGADIPGLDIGSETGEALLNAARQQARKKAIVTKPVPKEFEQAWKQIAPLPNANSDQPVPPGSMGPPGPPGAWPRHPGMRPPPPGMLLLFEL